MKSLEFNGKNILYKYTNGICWLAIKPVCEALGVNYNRQFQQLKSHRVFGPVVALQQMQVPGDQSRNMVCLPEEFIYGWLFSINSNSEKLIHYQIECNHILYHHFHGSITRRAQLYSELAEEKARINRIEEALIKEELFIEWNASRMRAARLWKNIKNTSDISPEFMFE